MSKRKPEASRPYSQVPDGFEPLGTTPPNIAPAFGDLSPADLAILQELKGKEAALMAWLAADPTRAALLQKDPKTAINELLLHLQIDPRDLKELDLPDGWRVEPLQVRQVVDTGAATLLGAVWTYLNAAAANLSAFTSDPIATVRAVASNTGATTQQEHTVASALSTVLGLAQPKEDFAGLHRNAQLVTELRSTPGAVFLRRL